MGFLDRRMAGRQLARLLARYRDEQPIILALPRGGVPVAVEVAKALRAPLDLLIVRKIGVPQQPELAAGAVVDSEKLITVRNEDVIGMAELSESEFDRIRQAEIQELQRRRKRYLGKRARARLQDRTVIVVDDGVATGATMRAALRAVQEHHPRQVVLATPVAATDALEQLRGEADRIECVEAHRHFGGIGNFYSDFSQVSDEEVVAMLGEAAAP